MRPECYISHVLLTCLSKCLAHLENKSVICKYFFIEAENYFPKMLLKLSMLLLSMMRVSLVHIKVPTIISTMLLFQARSWGPIKRVQYEAVQNLSEGWPQCWCCLPAPGRELCQQVKNCLDFGQTGTWTKEVGTLHNSKTDLIQISAIMIIRILILKWVFK